MQSAIKPVCPDPVQLPRVIQLKAKLFRFVDEFLEQKQLSVCKRFSTLNSIV